jgi:hypothetical protein
MDRKLAPVALVVACLLAGCGSTTPTAPPPSPAGSPAAHVDVSAPADGDQAPPSSSAPAPSASAAPQATPTPIRNPEAVRAAAGAGYLASIDAMAQAFEALKPLKPRDDRFVAAARERDAAAIWGQHADDLNHLQVPADTAAHLRGLIRRTTAFQALLFNGPADRSDDAWWEYRRHVRNKLSKYNEAAERVRSDLGLPFGCYDPEKCSHPYLG